jgi:hypothetical protein
VGLYLLWRPKGSTRRPSSPWRRRLVVTQVMLRFWQLWHDGCSASHFSLCERHQLQAVACLGRLPSPAELVLILIGGVALVDDFGSKD